MTRKKVERRFVLCVYNDEYPAALEVRKLYVALGEADAEMKGFVRVIDESSEDYLYPKRYFVALELPKAATKVAVALQRRRGMNSRFREVRRLDIRRFEPTADR